jgi:hypothetical protein
VLEATFSFKLGNTGVNSTANGIHKMSLKNLEVIEPPKERMAKTCHSHVS